MWLFGGFIGLGVFCSFASTLNVQICCVRHINLYIILLTCLRDCCKCSQANNSSQHMFLKQLNKQFIIPFVAHEMTMILHGTMSQLLSVVGRNGNGFQESALERDDSPRGSVTSMWTGKFYIWSVLVAQGNFLACQSCQTGWRRQCSQGHS